MIYSDILHEKSNVILSDLLNRCCSVKSMNRDEIENISKLSAISVNNNDSLPKELNDLMQRWYNSLSPGEVTHSPDYSVYGEDEYIAELWACWKVYSRTHLRNIKKTNSLFDRSIVSEHADDKTIVDLGCGFAYTTASIKQIFPKAEVYGTNLDNTLQMSVAKQMAKDYNFNMASDPSLIPTRVDLAFASEYFEHFERPIDHLDYVINTINPKSFLIANAFGPKAIGHFNMYEVKINNMFGYDWIDANRMTKFFNDAMRYYGYKKVKTNLWNNRPSYWIKDGINGE
jgi:hypothetical protein